jgi:protein-tyrosine kinase
MGKFFDALGKLQKPAAQDAPRPVPAGQGAAGSPPDKVVKLPSDDIEKLLLYRSAQVDVLPPPDVNVSATDQRLVCLREPTSPAAESFRILRSKLLDSSLGEPRRVIMVTSPEPQDGKTLFTANLAVSIALGINSHVLLVDCDLRRPGLHRIFGLKGKRGLREYLEEGSSVGSYLLKTQVEKLTLLPAGRPLDSPSELLSSPKMRLLTEEIKERYQDRFLILDTPPAQFFADAASLFSIVDGVLVIVRSGKTCRNLVQDVITNIGRERILGIVFNASNDAQRSYKYYDRYYRKPPQLR